MTKSILVTGAAGFIGFHLSRRLMRDGLEVVGVDNLNNYYDRQLKEERLRILRDEADASAASFDFHKVDISNREAVEALFANIGFDVVINLAAQAGVRFSLESPHSYADSNLTGFLNILEGCRAARPNHLIFASSSSVYGMNTKVPFAVADNTDYPVSLYAATKKSNELMAHAYSHLYNLPITGLRFFTVYGPFGRPDMAYFKFAQAISEGKPIDVFNSGNMYRDFTYIDDVVEGITRLVDKVPAKRGGPTTNAQAPFQIFNVGNNNPVKLADFVSILEDAIGIKAIVNHLPMQPGDVPETYADVADLMECVDFAPSTDIAKGLESFVKWFLRYQRTFEGKA